MSKLGLFIASTCISILMCEGCARLLIPIRKLGPGLTEYHPVLGQVHKKNFRATHRSSEFTMTFSTNSLGFRGPDIKLPLPSDARILLFVGDSFTMGDGVNDGEEFPQLIAKRFASQPTKPPVLVINAGIADTGTARTLKFLNSYATEWRNPTVLIHQLSPNDFNDNMREGFYSLDSYGSLLERSGRAPKSLMRRLQPLVNSIPGLSRSHLIAGIRETLAGWSRRSSSGSPDSQSLHRQELLTFKLVEEVLRLAGSNRWPVIGLLVGLAPEQEKAVRKLYDRFDASTVVVPNKARSPDLYYEIDIHWNKKGHAYTANALLPAIRAKIPKLQTRQAMSVVRDRIAVQHLARESDT